MRPEAGSLLYWHLRWRRCCFDDDDDGGVGDNDDNLDNSKYTQIQPVKIFEQLDLIAHRRTDGSTDSRMNHLGCPVK